MVQDKVENFRFVGSRRRHSAILVWPTRWVVALVVVVGSFSPVVLTVG